MKEYMLRLYVGRNRICLASYLDGNNKITPLIALKKFGKPQKGTTLTIERVYDDQEYRDEQPGERYLAGV